METHLTASLGKSWHQEDYTNLTFNEVRDDGTAVASAGPNAYHLHLSPDNLASTLPLIFYRLDALPDAQPTASKHLWQL